MARFGRFTLLLILASAEINLRLAAAETDAGPLPNDTAILEFNIPVGATLSVDGQDYGSQTYVRFHPLEPGKLYRSEVAIRFADRRVLRRSILLRGGWRIPLRIQSFDVPRPEPMVQTGHFFGMGIVAAYSPNGKQIATGSLNGQIIIWDATNGRQLRTLRSYSAGSVVTSAVTSLAFSADGRYVANDAGHQVVIWNIESGEKISTITVAEFERFSSGAGKLTLALHPNGRELLTSFGGEVVVWDVQSGSKVRSLTGIAGDVPTACFEQQGRRFVTATAAGTVILWNYETGSKEQDLREGADKPCTVAFSSDGKLVAVSDQRRAIVYDSETGKVVKSRELDCPGKHFNGFFSWDVRRLVTYHATETDAFLTLWNLHDNEQRVLLIGEPLDGLLEACDVAFRPDGKEFVVHDSVYNTQSGELLYSLKSTGAAITKAQFIAGDKYLAALSSRGVGMLWSTEGNCPPRSIETPHKHSRVAFLPDGRLLITNRETERSIVRDLLSGEEVDNPSHLVDATSFSPDGRRCLVDTADNTVTVHDVATGQTVQTLAEHRGKIQSTAYSASGKQIAMGTDDGTISVWNPTTGALYKTIAVNKPSVYSVEFSPDDRSIVAAYGDRQPESWDLESGKKTRRFECETDVFSARFDPTGHYVITKEIASLKSEPSLEINRRKITIWDAAGGRRLRSFVGDIVEFSPDDRHVVTAFHAGATSMWDVRTGAKIHDLKGPSHAYVYDMQFSFDGRRIVIAADDCMARLWDVATGDEVVSLAILNEGKDWLATTSDGFFDGSPGGREAVAYRVGGGLNVVPVDRFFQDFYRPGLFSEVMAGNRPLPDAPLGRDLPPKLKIISSVASLVETRQVTIETEAADQGGGVAPLMLFQNGARVLAPGEVRQAGALVRRSFQVTLVEGDNHIQIKSATSDGSWEAEPVEILVRFERPIPKSRLFVVAVGINDYFDNQLDLRYAASDATAFAEMFKRRGESLYEEVRVARLVDGQATKSAIVSALKNAAGETRPQDTFILFLAGHGTMVGERFYFLPHEMRRQSDQLENDIRSQGLPADEIFDYLGPGSLQALKRVVVLDTCASGGALRLASLVRTPFAFRGAIERLSRAQGVFAIAASSAQEKARESAELGHGVLSYALLAGLREVQAGPLAENAVQPADAGRVVNVVEWFNFASEHVPRLTERLHHSIQDVEIVHQGKPFPLLPLDE